MCGVAAATLAITIATTAIQARQAGLQKQFQRQVARNAQISARANLGNALTQQNLRREQERDKAIRATQIVTRKALRTQGLALASAASEGTSGASVDALVGDFQQQQLEQMDLIDQNLEIVNLQLNQERLGAEARANAEILSGQGAGVPIPDYLSNGLQIFSSTDEIIRQNDSDPDND